MSIILLFFLVLVTLVSIALVVLPEEQLSEHLKTREWLVTAAGIAGLFFLVMLAIKVGGLARGETSPLPWEAFSIANGSHGLIDGLSELFLTTSFLLWGFLIPGHLKASSRKRATGSRPSYPYVINFLVGLILATPGNAIYGLLSVA